MKADNAVHQLARVQEVGYCMLDITDAPPRQARQVEEIGICQWVGLKNGETYTLVRRLIVIGDGLSDIHGFRKYSTIEEPYSEPGKIRFNP